MSRARMSLSLPAHLVAWARQRAVAEQTSVSAVVEQAVRRLQVADNPKRAA